jgi:hypothetical protein
MLNFGKYAAIAAAGLGLAALAAPQAEACGFVRTYGCAPVSSQGWGQSFGMYRPVTTYRPVLAYRPVTRYRPVYGYAYRPIYRPAYAYAAPVRYYRPFARIYRPATYAWAVPHVRVYRPVYGAAYGYAPRFRTIGAYGCGC